MLIVTGRDWLGYYECGDDSSRAADNCVDACRCILGDVRGSHAQYMKNFWVGSGAPGLRQIIQCHQIGYIA